MDDDGLLATAGNYFQGSARFLDAVPGGREPHPRIYVSCRMAGVDPGFLALVDTGGHFCILNQEVADQVRDQRVDGLGRVKLRTAYGLVEGELYSHRLTLVAGFGESVDIEASVFVSPDWKAPSFIGYSGALERVRFAVDPFTNRFYFGSPD